ncbi:MAG TPA: FlgD immunoglobulin-like domain containing protein [Candidatus Eisenbacteria bacterium]
MIQVGSGAAAPVTALGPGAGAGDAAAGEGPDIGREVSAGGFGLDAGYPNPFRAHTQIRFALPRSGNVRLIVYDVMGRAARVLVDGHTSAGTHQVSWDGRDDAGHSVSSGIYLLRLETSGLVSTRRLLRLRP